MIDSRKINAGVQAMMRQTVAINEKTEALLDMEILPDFADTMGAVCESMGQYMHEPLSECIIVTDVLGYGHFSYSEEFTTYKEFLGKQPNLKMVVLNDEALESIGPRWVSGEATPQNRARLLEAARKYCDMYYRESIPKFEAIATLASPLGRLHSLVMDGKQAQATSYEDLGRLVVDSICCTKRYLRQQMAKNLPHNSIIESMTASAIHIWYFHERDVVFALTDLTRMKVTGFRSQNLELNRGLRAVALSAPELGKPLKAKAPKVREQASS